MTPRPHGEGTLSNSEAIPWGLFLRQRLGVDPADLDADDPATSMLLDKLDRGASAIEDEIARWRRRVPSG